MAGAWPICLLSEVATINPRRDSALKSMDPKVKVSFVPMAAVDETSGTISAPEIRPFSEVMKGFTPFQDDDVIFAKITPCMQNGKSAVAGGLANGLGFGSTEFHVVRPGTAVLPRWIWYFVRQRSVRDQAQRHFRGSAGQQRVPEDFLGQLLIPVPELEVQRRVLAEIDACMDRVFEIRSLRNLASEEGDALLPSSLAATFFNLRENHPTETIGNCLLESKYGTNRKCSATGSGTPVLRIPNVAKGEVSLDDLKYCELNEKELARVRLEDGDVLVVRTNGSPDLVGRCAVFSGGQDDFAFASYLIRLRVKPDKLDSDYLSYFLASTLGRDAIAGIRRTSAGQYNINSENIRAISLPLPPLSVQKMVTEKLSEQRQIANAISRSLATRAEEANLLAGAVLRSAFAGEL